MFRFSGEVTNKRNLVTLFSQPKCLSDIHVSDIPFSDSLLEKKTEEVLFIRLATTVPIVIWNRI